MENEPFSTELLRRIPQKLFLNERDYPGWLPVLVLGISWVAGGGWVAFALQAGWEKQAAAIGAASCLLAGYAFWLVITCFVVPVLRARGWYPVVEYLPDEGKIIVSDRPGDALWGAEHAVVTVYLESISGITLENRGKSWVTMIRLRKGEPILVGSATRSDRALAAELASTLAAMISVPLREEPVVTTGREAPLPPPAFPGTRPPTPPQAPSADSE
ncbi:MAG TPA: hypothetical protein VIV61_11805 [Candidatus Ozemobacteraceae bacterium]